MNLPYITIIVTLIISFITVCIWLWKLLSWFRKDQSESKNMAKEFNLTAKQLLSMANSPAKRANINSYVILRSILNSKRQIKELIHLVAMGIWQLILTLGFVAANSLSKFVFFVEYPYITIIFTAFIIVTWLTYFRLMWLCSRTRTIENGWETGALETILEFTEKDLPDN